MIWTRYHIELAWKWGANLSGANLSGADLSGADLSRTDLYGVDLSGADLSRTDLYGADLSGADLSEANLSEADLSGADLSEANLSEADLSGADLSEANLSEADLSGVDLSGANLPPFSIAPEKGSFTAFKKLQDGITIEVQIPKEAKRTSSLVGRKCRAEYVKVVEGSGLGLRDGLEYKQGSVVKADSFDDDIRVECTNGIHFFMTRKEAEDYVL